MAIWPWIAKLKFVNNSDRLQKKVPFITKSFWQSEVSYNVGYRSTLSHHEMGVSSENAEVQAWTNRLRAYKAWD